MVTGFAKHSDIQLVAGGITWTHGQAASKPRGEALEGDGGSAVEDAQVAGENVGEERLLGHLDRLLLRVRVEEQLVHVDLGVERGDQI